MTKQYSVKYPTRRWPIAVWYNILNLAGINSWILYKEVNNSNISRREFLIKLVEEIFESLDSDTSYINKTIKIVEKDLCYWRNKLPSTSQSTSITSNNSNDSFLSSMSPTLNKKRKSFGCQTKLCNNNRSINSCSQCSRSCCGQCC